MRRSLALGYEKEGVGEFGEVPSHGEVWPDRIREEIAIERADERQIRPLFLYTSFIEFINPFGE
jgi:hypothetical protein